MGDYNPTTYAVIDIETTLNHETIHGTGVTLVDNGRVLMSEWAISPEQLSNMLNGVTHVVGHNIIGFDLPILAKAWDFKLPQSIGVIDTLVLSRLSNPSREHGHSLRQLAICCGLNQKQDFDLADFDGPVTQKMVDYCIADTMANKDVFELLLRELKDFSEESIHLEHMVAKETRLQESNGFKLDFPLACSIHTQHTARMEEIEQELQEVFPPIVEERWSEKTGKRLKDKVTIFTPGSRVQVAERLSEKGAVWEELTPTSGRAKVDETTLSHNIHIPEAKLVLEYLIISKRLGMVTAWVNAVEEDGRIHGRVNTCGAVTGRMTHSKPNLAQIPSDPLYRECFTVADGNQLVGCDASGLELRMLAHYMKDEEYTDLILNGDIHAHNQKLAGLKTRDQAKTFIYALLYGAGDGKIGSVVDGTAKHGAILRSRFMRGLPSYAVLMKSIGKIMKARDTLPGLDGRRLHVRSEHSALNTLLQSAGAVVMKKALVLATEALRDAGIPYTLVAQVHDEVQVEAQPQYAEQIGQAFRKAIQDAGTYYNMRCPLDGEYKIGPNWSHTH